MSNDNLRFHLEASPADIIDRLPAAGKLMIIGRGQGFVHERMGEVDSVCSSDGWALIHGNHHDSAIRMNELGGVMLDYSTVMREKVYPRIELLHEDGSLALSIVGLAGKETFEAAFAEFPSHPAPPQPAKAGDDKSTEAELDGSILPLNIACQSKAKVSIEFRNAVLHQNWHGEVTEVKDMMGFANVITPDFHLHLGNGAVARWQTEREGADTVCAAIGHDGAKLGLLIRSTDPAFSVREGSA